MNRIEFQTIFPSLVYFLIYSLYLFYWVKMIEGIGVIDMLLWFEAHMSRIRKFLTFRGLLVIVSKTALLQTEINDK